MPAGWPENDGVRLDPNKPEALGTCDYCGKTLHLSELRDQVEFGGPGLINLHFRVGPECYDKPQEQLRSIVLPPDPRPVMNPRPENYVLDNGLQGFTQYVVTQLDPNITYAQLVAAVAPLGTQPALTNRSTTITSAFSSQQIVAAGTYIYMLIYNPSNANFGISLSVPASFTADVTTTLVGGGTAMLQSAANGDSVWQGPINVIGTQAGAQILIATG